MSLEKETRDVQNKVLNKNNLKLINWNSGYPYQICGFSSIAIRCYAGFEKITLLNIKKLLRFFLQTCNSKKTKNKSSC